MTSANRPLHEGAQPTTTIESLHAETEDYHRLTDLLRATRELFGQNEHEAALRACEGLTPLMEELERRALERTGVWRLKFAPEDTEENQGESALELDNAHCELLKAQTQARTELLVTADILSDLRAHTAALRGNLWGRRAPTYSSRGELQQPGG